jgi:hypothetical protein
MMDPTLIQRRAGELIMSINLRESDRDQLFLLPPSVANWLPSDYIAFFGLDVVAEFDLTAFYADYRSDGRVAYDPSLVLSVLINAYCVGDHSSRRIERRLTEDVAFRVVAANQHLELRRTSILLMQTADRSSVPDQDAPAGQMRGTSS